MDQGVWTDRSQRHAAAGCTKAGKLSAASSWRIATARNCMGLFTSRSLDGPITNDKLCLSRSGRLVLSWWRFQHFQGCSVTDLMTIGG